MSNDSMMALVYYCVSKMQTYRSESIILYFKLVGAEPKLVLGERDKGHKQMEIFVRLLDIDAELKSTPILSDHAILQDPASLAGCRNPT